MPITDVNTRIISHVPAATDGENGLQMKFAKFLQGYSYEIKGPILFKF